MHSIIHPILPRLDLFDGEAAGESAGGSGEPGSERAPEPAQETETKAETGTPEAALSRRQAYREAKREYRDLYEQDVQRLLDKRFRETRALRETIEAAEAEKRRAEDERTERAGALLEKWTREGEALRARYPGFDLEREAKNAPFVALLRAGEPMERAWRAAHMEEILAGAIRQAAAVTERRVAEHIRARGQRPAEAGLGAQTGVVVKNDVARLTRADRADLARRAMQGESISF